ncbi:hypothetical protein UlMin_021687 [Ulmus minor]
MGYQQNNQSIAKARFDEAGEEIIDSYTSWLEKHPSALDSFDEMMSKAKENDMAVFLDYDGTLSPIVEDPEKAFMTDAMRAAVREVGMCFPTAVVSGRGKEKVYQFVQLKNVYYAGSHGMDISTPLGSSKYNGHKHETKGVDDKGNEVVNFCPAQEFLPTIQEILKALREKIKSIRGSMVEDNKFCISVHYRRVNEQDVDTLKEIVEKFMQDYSNFKISGGKKVMEIRPKIDWDKGQALQYLLDTLGFSSSKDVLPIYIGDDRTDEDAFKVIQKMGRGFPIIVSSTPKQTKVKSFLVQLVKWKRSFDLNKLRA